MKPINTYKRFFRYLRKARVERGVTFVILRSNLRIKNDERKSVNAFSIWATLYMTGGMTAYLSPFQVLHRTFFQGEGVKEWLGSDSSAKAMGMPLDKAVELTNAQIEGRKHLPSLRRRMIKACGLTDTPTAKRARYNHYGPAAVVPVSEDDVPF